MKAYLDKLVQSSAIRLLDKELASHYGSKSLFLIGSKKGIGKTSILTQIAIDHLLREEQIVHLSFFSSVEETLLWYDTLVTSMAKELKVSFIDLKEFIAHNRMILNFSHEETSIAKIVETLSTIKDTILPNATTLFIEGFSFLKADITDLARLKNCDLEIWMSADFDTAQDSTLLKPYKHLINQLIMLEPHDNLFTLRLDKSDKTLPLVYNPHTMLLEGH